MKRLLWLLLLGATAVHAQRQDTIRVADFGMRPDSFESCTVPLQAAIEACKRHEAKVLVFDPGRYDIWPEGAVRRELFVSNTSTEAECPSKVKTLGMLLEEVDRLTVEGNGATLVFHGKITPIALIRCRDVELRNLHIDFERPGGSEMTYVGSDSTGVEVVFHPDTRYAVVDGRIVLYGEGWRSEHNHCIEFDPAADRFFYSEGWSRLSDAPAAEQGARRVRFATQPDFRPRTGNTLTVRDIIRDQVGMLLLESRDVALRDVDVHYMHGLGIVSQYSHNVTMQRVRCAPREGSGRILASSADFMHFSGCSGRIRILACRFSGAQDDCINIHGTNLRAMSRTSSRSLRLRFMHGQSYGFEAFSRGDTAAFVRAETMERFARAQITEVRRLSDRETEITFDREIPADLRLDADCVENLTATPEVEIRGCHFTRTSTRGTLVTTPRKVVIADNTYYHTGMSAILIEGDASGWYESGPVEDVLITGNRFVGCAWNGGPDRAVIAVNPSNTRIDPDRPVHRNIRIEGNRFETVGNPVLSAKSTQGLVFRRNEVTDCPSWEERPQPLVLLNGCKEVEIRRNSLPPARPQPLAAQNMPRNYIRSDLHR